MTRNIGIKVTVPKSEIKKGDMKNPFNGTLSIRGKIFEGAQAQKTQSLLKKTPL